jgi:MraZ protein
LGVSVCLQTTQHGVTSPFILGEFRRTLDDRYRVAVPTELSNLLTTAGPNCILVKERAGSLSLWSAAGWTERLQQGTRLVHAKMEAGRLDQQIEEVQTLGRLLSTRHRPVQLAARGRLVVPEGFREFLGVAPGGDVMIVGAALCVELWQPTAWIQYVQQQIPEFHQLFDKLTS